MLAIWLDSRACLDYDRGTSVKYFLIKRINSRLFEGHESRPNPCCSPALWPTDKPIPNGWERVELAVDALGSSYAVHVGMLHNRIYALEQMSEKTSDRGCMASGPRGCLCCLCSGHEGKHRFEWE